MYLKKYTRFHYLTLIQILMNKIKKKQQKQQHQTEFIRDYQTPFFIHFIPTGYTYRINEYILLI
jgi:hypothetical protein